MGRVPDLDPATLTADQKRVHDEIAAKRHGTVRGPFAIWLRNANLADRANAFGNALRSEGKLEKRLFEMMTLIIARRFSAQYEWFAHEHQARKDGVSHEVIEALRVGKTPDFKHDDEKLVYDVTTALLQGGLMDHALYDRALAHFGLDLLIELVAAVGFYSMVAMTLIAFDAPVPDGSRPLP
jgi:4-carboxymuconolactone decarboxylase